jgi:lysophospholipase L1-like esterase
VERALASHSLALLPHQRSLPKIADGSDQAEQLVAAAIIPRLDDIVARREDIARAVASTFVGQPNAPDLHKRQAVVSIATDEIPMDRPKGLSAPPALDGKAPPERRLTILQIGDSHTAADFFTGRVRERLQEKFGDGGDAYVAPGKPHLGVRSALFESSTSDGWTYEALQKSNDERRFYLSGFNAIAHRAGAYLDLKARGEEGYDKVDVAFLTQPGAGRAEVLLDGRPGGEVNLDGPENHRKTVRIVGSEVGTPRFHEVAVRALTGAPVTITGFEVGRRGDGVSYLSLGFPGATVQLLQKLAAENLADDLTNLAPDIIVLAFGTNEGFDDSLNVGVYTAQYASIVDRLKHIRPGVKIVMIGPPDGARPAGVCRNSAVGRNCPAPPAAPEADKGCRLATPPKLDAVREAQRELARRVGAYFWDWSSVMPRCGAEVWAASNPPLMAPDHVHMTMEGYKRTADQFADFLIPLVATTWTPIHVVSHY